LWDQAINEAADFMEQNPSREFPYPLWNPKFHFRVHKIHYFILSEINSDHALTSYLSKLNLDITLPSTLSSPKCSLPSGFPSWIFHVFLNVPLASHFLVFFFRGLVGTKIFNYDVLCNILEEARFLPEELEDHPLLAVCLLIYHIHTATVHTLRPFPPSALLEWDLRWFICLIISSWLNDTFSW
jgi:hypothetical protein